MGWSLLERWSRRLRPPAELPTAEYYFLAGVGDLVGPPRGGAPIVRHGPHTFAAGDRLVVIRYATPAELALIEGRRWAQVDYVVDDMLPIAGQCAELPAGYRQRLARFAADVLPRILAAGPVVVSPRRETLDLFPAHAGALLDPAWLYIADSHAHFNELRDGRVRMAFLGTRSHGAGMDDLASIVERLQKLPSPPRLTLFAGKHLAPRLARYPNLDNRAPLSWAAFKTFQRRERFHLLLAPLPDTPFNRGRSITKLMDIAAVGAVGLCGDRAPFAGRIANGEDGLLLPDAPEAWAEAVRELLARPEQARAMAIGGARLARRLGDPARVRRFWLDRLGLEDGSVAPPGR